MSHLSQYVHSLDNVQPVTKYIGIRINSSKFNQSQGSIEDAVSSKLAIPLSIYPSYHYDWQKHPD